MGLFFSDNDNTKFVDTKEYFSRILYFLFSLLFIVGILTIGLPDRDMLFNVAVNKHVLSGFLVLSTALLLYLMFRPQSKRKENKSIIIKK